VILVDTSVWVDHIRKGDPSLERLLDERLVWTHPCVIGELALGNLPDRTVFLTDLRDLPQVKRATHDEVAAFIEAERLYGLGIGYSDAHLLASARLVATTLWTRDRRLLDAAETLGVAAPIS
jgi:hypothetical protein